MQLLKIVLAIILPPLGIFLEVGLSGTLLLNILLTLLGWLPGAVHALWVISKGTGRSRF
ncbi:MAG: YqaE/Pmp3 family membrane protein [Cyanobacteria bacterium P01_A01_bin.17]